MIEFEKMVRDGKVAVLYSPGFGAGWSTWADDNLKAFAQFDKGLVELAERGAKEDEVEAYIAEKTGDAYFYLGGWKGIRVEWLPQGTHFIISEYDGSESIDTVDSLTIVA